MHGEITSMDKKRLMGDLNKIYMTDKYDLFLIDGNRGIESAKLKKLFENIKKHGLIKPISVNRNYFILDGQHRCLTCKNLETSVKYTISDVKMPRPCRRMKLTEAVAR